MNTDVDIMIFGGARGAGKSRLLLMKPLRYLLEDSNFHGVFFRNTTGELTNAGGLWPEGTNLYDPFNPKLLQKQMRWTFPIGSTLTCRYMEYEQDKDAHRGLQYSFIGWDELDRFTETQFISLMACLRSRAKSNSFTIATCNPNPDSWIIDWINWWLDDEGFPIEERCGVVRHFILKDGKPQFGATEKEIAEKFPENVWVTNRATGEKFYVRPKTFTFINGTVFDNPALIEENPSYVSDLQNLEEHERARMLWGNWYIRPVGSNYFKREWLKKSKPPFGSWCVRAYDVAATQRSEVNKNPDFTASIKVWKCREGYYYLQGDFHPEFKDVKEGDGNEPELGRFRRVSGDRDQKILSQAVRDGDDCKVVVAIDPGAGGKVAFEAFYKKMLEEGFLVKADPMPQNKSKLQRYEPFASAAYNGLVYIDEDSFPRDSLELFLKEHESFTGERSAGTRHDDWVDATTAGFNFISKKRPFIPISRLPVSDKSSTKKKEILG